MLVDAKFRKECSGDMNTPFVFSISRNENCLKMGGYDTIYESVGILASV